MCLAFLRDTDGEYIQTGKIGRLSCVTIRTIVISTKFPFLVHFFRLYCKHADLQFDSPEDELKYFLNKTKNSRWKWKGRTPVPPEHAIHCK